MSKDFSFLKKDILLFNSQSSNKEESPDDINIPDASSSDSEPGLKRYFTLKSNFINDELVKTSHSVQINDTQVYFPYVPYIPQKVLMQRVLESIEQRKNALLESPTGTGKTLSLLCASLGWLQSKKKTKQLKKTKIFYATRTHSQIKQIVKELKKTPYNPVTCILAARDHYCLKFKDEEGTDTKSLRTKCNEATKSGNCEFVAKLNEAGDDFIRETKRTVRDIEDAVDFGKGCGTCPYYYQRSLLEKAELVILPYSYLLDHRIREDVFNSETNTSLENQIIIFDEAHNIEKAAEDGLSFTISLKDMENSLQDLKIAEGMKTQLSPGNYAWLKENIDYVKIAIYELRNKAEKKHSKNHENSILIEGKEIFSVFKTFYYRDNGAYNIAINNLNIAVNAIHKDLRATGGLENLRDFLKLLQTVRVNIGSFWIILSSVQRNILLNFHCVNPALAFTDLKNTNPRCIILTSGTLRPLEAVKRELETPFEIELVNNHVIDPKRQTYSAIIRQGLRGSPLNFNHKNRENYQMIRDMGYLLIEISKIIPHGLLVSFASYSLMNLIIEFWKRDQNGVICSELVKSKNLFYEPRDTIQAKKVIDDYRSSAITKGAILFGVCKGKVFEGMDFPDQFARAVVVVGIPNPNQQELSVSSKLNYLTSLKAKGVQDSLSTEDWLAKEANRGICQAVGRVIRHANDYGVVLLCDGRFDNPKSKEALPCWVRENLDIANNFKDIQGKIANLLNQNSAKFSSDIIQRGVSQPRKHQLSEDKSEETLFENKKTKISTTSGKKTLDLGVAVPMFDVDEL